MSWAWVSRVRFGLAFALPTLLGVVLASGWIVSQRHAADERVRTAVRAAVAADVTIVRSELRSQLAAATTGGQPGDQVFTVNAALRPSVSWSNIAVTARDSGSAMPEDASTAPAIVVPIYRGSAAEAIPPADTAARRARIQRFRVVPLAMQNVLDQLVSQVGGLSVHGPNRLIASNPGPRPPSAVSFAVDMDITGSPGWTVEAWRPAPGVPGAAWFVGGAIVLLLAALGTVLSIVVARTIRDGVRRQALEQDRRLVTGLAPVVQSSLDIGEVVPAVAGHLADGLGLIGLSLSTSGAHGERQLFVWGVAPDPSVMPMPARPSHVDASRTLALALTRGGRALGVLRVVAGNRLSADQVVSLITASELVGSTLANAEAFAAQQDTLESMRSVDELKTVFLATASHELRTPVTAIVGFSTLLMEQWQTLPPERSRMLVERVKANGQRLDALIEQLLDFSRLERGLPRSATELLNLGATVARILDEQTQFAAEHDIEVTIGHECLVRGSASAVERVVTNLVGNAVKYSPAGTRVRVTVTSDGEHAVLLVDDEGPGVAEADRARIFSRFYRGRGDAVVRTRGAGIGLAIVAEYAGSMSATTDVDRAPGGGARFRVRFPAVAVSVTAAVSAPVPVTARPSGQSIAPGRLDVEVS